MTESGSGEPRLCVSVALATHNGAKYVEEQVRSILAQTRPVDEIVLSDDASSDDTIDIVERLVADHRHVYGEAPELLVLRNDVPLRVAANFQQAIEHCRGDLIALCDQDDRWHERKIERLMATFADEQTLLAFSNARQVDEDGCYLGHDLFTALELSAEERGKIDRGDAFAQFMRRNLVTGATAMIRRSLYELATPFPEAWLQDEWLAVVAAIYGEVAIVDECLIDYRQHGANQVGMRRMTLPKKFAVFAQPRTERNRRLYRRAQSLESHLRVMEGVSGRYLASASEKLQFEEARQRYPAVRVRRVIPILRQWRLGRYRNYGTGLKDAVRNLLQPV